MTTESLPVYAAVAVIRADETSRRLPIRPQPGQRHFVDRHGQPFFWLGDTQWELVRLFEVEQAREVLEDRKAKGFNVVLVMACGVGPGDRPNLHGHTPWVNNDPDRPNEEYFRHADEILAAAGELDMLVVLGVYHQQHRERLTSRNARAWARWIAARLTGAENVIWCMYPRAEQAYVPVCREIAAGLQEGDGGAHLISVHPDPAPTSSSFLAGEAWLAFDMIQTCVAQHLVYPMVASDVARLPARPVVFAEGAYEGRQFREVHTPCVIRRQAWWAALAGAWTVYGNVGNYEAPQAYRDWMAAAGSGQIAILRDVLGGLGDWWQLVPDQSVFEDGPGSGLSLRAAARCPRGRWVLAYLPQPHQAVIRMDRIEARETVRACWIDPATGQRTETTRFARTDKPALSPPAGWEDALLLLAADAEV